MTSDSSSPLILTSPLLTHPSDYAMTYYSSALSSVAYAPPSANAVRLFSLNNHPRTTTSKIVHLVRHAEGTHNLNEDESKLPTHFDAKLTPRGVEQCNKLARHTPNLDVDIVIVSPLTRCLDTSRLSFPHLYNNGTPFVANEDWRETVNFLCDCRSSTTVLKNNYPKVNFDQLIHEEDPIWSRYEKIFGSYTNHKSKRESDDPESLHKRAHLAWKSLLGRPERNIALVGHSAFFMHMFTPLFDELEGVVQYEDDDVRELMTGGRFDNCELRSVVVDVPII